MATELLNLRLEKFLRERVDPFVLVAVIGLLLAVGARRLGRAEDKPLSRE